MKINNYQWYSIGLVWCISTVQALPLKPLTPKETGEAAQKLEQEANKQKIAQIHQQWEKSGPKTA